MISQAITTGNVQSGNKEVAERQHELIVNDAPRTFTDADFPVGSVAHQGDLILVRIESLPSGCRKRAMNQLADGNTQGSRHVLAVGQAYDGDPVDISCLISSVCKGVAVQTGFIGPVFETIDGVADVTHPEHGDHLYRGDMVIACVYQREISGRSVQRVYD